MSKPKSTSNKREIWNIRINPEDSNLIDRATKIKGKKRTEFVLEAVLAAAEDVLFDQAIIIADPESYTHFLKRLETTPQPNEQLRKTLQTPAPWYQASL